jgi:tRNA pseudouridine32 synthase/23S rRNA pseudouridine746 synthase
MRTYKGAVRTHFAERTTLGEFLRKLTPLTPIQLGDVAEKGGVWIQRRGKGRILRIRSLRETVMPEDVIQVYFDPKVLAFPALAELAAIYEDANFGVWVKPAGAVPQGSQASDHASVLRYVEKVRGAEVFLVHRLDRETRGLMLVAYTAKAAGALGDLFQKHKIHKEYEAVVLGELPAGSRQTIAAALDDKEAVTHVEVLEARSGRSLLRVTIETGRLHQIRRHLDFLGHPVIGDPKYGKGNKNRQGLQLVASVLAFTDPWTKELRRFELPEHLSLLQN